MDQQILIEQLNPTESNLIITESSTDSKECWLTGVFMQADIKNRNGRNYPLNEISAACNHAQSIIQETNGIFGELDHPSTLTVNLDRISHVITDLQMEGANAMGRAKILPTPMGNIARTLVESGARLGVSSRGAGAVGNDGNVSGFNFVTVDIVATPSAPGAMPNSIYEGVEGSQFGKEIISLSEQLQTDPEAQEYLKREIMKFLKEGLFAKA
jgi:hypothetical protein